MTDTTEAIREPSEPALRAAAFIKTQEAEYEHLTMSQSERDIAVIIEEETALSEMIELLESLAGWRDLFGPGGGVDIYLIESAAIRAALLLDKAQVTK